MKKHLLIVCFTFLLSITICILVTDKAKAQALNNDTDNSSFRISGENRYQTAKAISEYYNGGIVENVILASGDGFADALSAGVLASKLGAPILLIDSTPSASQDAFSYINEHLDKDGTVYIIGGTGVVGRNFIYKLNSMGFEKIIQIGGQDRYDTSYQIASKLNVSKGTPIVISSGEDYPDVLSISSFAAYNGWPILLVQKDKISQNVQDLIMNIKPSKVYITGGEGVISPLVESEVQALSSYGEVIRLSGEDRFDTAAKVLQAFAPNPKRIYVASGYSFADALAGSVLAAKTGDPIVLVDPDSKELSSSIEKYLEKLRASNSGMDIIFFGGVGVIPDIVADSINRAVRGIELKVLVLNFDPVIEIRENKKLHDIGNWNSPRIMVQQTIDDFRECSKNYINFEIANWIDLDEFPLAKDGFMYDDEAYIKTLDEAKAARKDWWAYEKWQKPDGYLFDYDYYINKYNLPELIKNKKIDEVWIFAPPCDGTGIYESQMVGKDAYFCNSPPLSREDTKRFVIMGFNYERGADSMLESFGHRFESTMANIYGLPDYKRPLENMNKWERFTLYDKVSPGNAGCGNIHFAPNSNTEYDWGNRRKVWTSYIDWLSYPSLTGDKLYADSSAWGGGDMRLHHKWWFKCIPKASGIDELGYLNNWWQYFAYLK